MPDAILSVLRTFQSGNSHTGTGSSLPIRHSWLNWQRILMSRSDRRSNYLSGDYPVRVFFDPRMGRYTLSSHRFFYVGNIPPRP